MEVGRLRGDRVTLRAWRAGDADWYVAARDETVLAFTTERDELTVAEITDGAAEISYFLAPDGRGRGLVTDAIRTVVRWLRSQPVAFVRAVTTNGNDASAASLTRAGFQPAGVTEHLQLGPSTRWELALAAG
ncbi:GNAT family N-acetyltransferase [Jiangella gansuensis]|uniref:GNAT family N-acetyltransferase n=1 Tax=Jiangella gansuensis TaxID=281473 RepID=UPI0004BCEA0A|nr:GNAT family protein [Jiangella gansuensis]